MAKQNNSNGNKSGKQNATKPEAVENVITPNEVIEDNKTETKTESTEAVENVITPTEVIEVSEKPIKKTDNGKVLVSGTHTSVQVSPATAKIMAKFKK